MKRLFLFLTAALIVTGTASAGNFGISVGGGLGLLYLQNSVETNASTFQDGVLSMYRQTYQATYALAGANVSMDLTRFLNVRGGVWIDIGASNDSGQGLYNYSGVAGKGLIVGDFGASLKWPFDLTDQTAISPEIGIDDVSYLIGGAGGSSHPTNDEKRSVSPLLITVGADFDERMADDWIVRLPIEIGFGLNGQFADEHYSDTSIPTAIGLRLELLHPL